MATSAKAKVAISVTADGLTHHMAEGDVLNNLVYNDKDGSQKSVTGKLRVIAASTEKQSVDPHTCCPPDPYLGQYINVDGIIVDSSIEKIAVLTRIAIKDVVSIESVTKADAANGIITVDKGPFSKPLTDVISEAPAGSTIKLAPGVYDEPITIDKSINIIGEAGAKMTKLLTVKATGEDPVDVSIEGVTFETDGYIDVQKADSFTMVGCTMENMTSPESGNSYPIKLGAVPMKVTIDGNYFRASSKNSNGKILVKNGIESNAIMADGSSISNNYFAGDFCPEGKPINIYDAQDFATITVAYNYFDEGSYRTRIGIKDEHRDVVIKYIGNIAVDCNPGAPDWCGLVLFQPYGSVTKSWKGLTVYFEKNENVGQPMCYLFTYSGNMQFTPETVPTIYIDGEKIEVPGELCEDRTSYVFSNPAVKLIVVDPEDMRPIMPVPTL